MNYDDFDAYMRGELNETEHRDFEARLHNEPALRDALGQHRAALESLRRNQRQGDIASIGRRALRRQTWRRYAQAIALLLLLTATVAGIWFWTKPEPLPPEPVAHIPQPDENLSGATSAVFEQKNAARGIRIANGRPIPDTAAVYRVMLSESLERTAHAAVQGTEVRLFFPVGQMPQPAQIWLIELHREGRSDLFLQNDGNFYLLRQGQQELMPLTDQTLLAWLK
jgi:hypothetical protein